MATLHILPDHPQNYIRIMDELNQHFQTDADCLEFMYLAREKEGSLICAKCSEKNFKRDYGSRFIICIKCNTRLWITSGTLFEKTKKLKAWFTGAWFIARGIQVSTPIFEEIANVAQSTAWQILNTYSMLLGEYIEERTEEVPSVLFMKMICKRSRETAKREHPKTEIFDQFKEEFESILGTISDDSKDSESSSEVTSLQEPVTEIEKSIINELSGKKYSFDYLCKKLKFSIAEISSTISMLEVKGLIKQVGPNIYKACVSRNQLTIEELVMEGLNSVRPGLLMVADNIISYIRSKFHGISRKYLQGYLMRAWMKFSKKKLAPEDLLNFCFHHKPISYFDIKRHVCPYNVFMVPV